MNITNLSDREIRCLVVDDESDLLEALRVRLESGGFCVQTASSAEEALKKIIHNSQKQFHVLITDVRMGGGSGYDLLNLSQFVAIEMPVIMISGHEAKSVMEKIAGEKGVFACIEKPIDSKQLFDAVEKALAA